MASNTPVKAPDWWILFKGFTVEHGGWKPSLSFWRLIIPPLYLSLRGLGNLLLLCSSLGLVFRSRTRSPSFYYLFSFLLSLPFWISRIKLKWYRGLRREKGRGGGSFGYVNFSDASLPGCNSIKCIKLLWPFLWMPISSEVVMSTCCWESMSVDISSVEGGWLNTSNSSEDSDKVTITSGFSSSSSSSYFFYSSSSSWRTEERVGMRMLQGWPQRVAEWVVYLQGLEYLLELRILRKQH